MTDPKRKDQPAAAWESLDPEVLDQLVVASMRSEQQEAAAPPEVREAGVLTVYATHTQYPSMGEDVEESEHREALKLAERVVQRAEETIRGGRA